MNCVPGIHCHKNFKNNRLPVNFIFLLSEWYDLFLYNNSSCKHFGMMISKWVRLGQKSNTFIETFILILIDTIQKYILRIFYGRATSSWKLILFYLILQRPKLLSACSKLYSKNLVWVGVFVRSIRSSA